MGKFVKTKAFHKFLGDASFLLGPFSPIDQQVPMIRGGGY
jgi:hypothetical protein